MAELIDDVLENPLQKSSIEDGVSEEELQPKVEVKPEEDDLPEKYRGKSPKEIIAMHQEAEKLIGRQGSEVGELRKVVDDFIKTQTTRNSETQQQTELSEEDFFVDPKSTVNKAIENHPAIKEAKQHAEEMRKVETITKLKTEFPNYVEVAQSPDFVDWIKSSKVRLELLARAENFDYDSAKELLSTWNERQEITKKVTAASKADRESQLKAADTSVSNSTESVAKKKYRRSDIIKLMQTDPDRYEAMSSEIMAAYREGRVI